MLTRKEWDYLPVLGRVKGRGEGQTCVMILLPNLRLGREMSRKPPSYIAVRVMKGGLLLGFGINGIYSPYTLE